MQKIQPNSRQIPKVKEYMAHKGYSDNIYSYLQHISHWDGNPGEPRYIYKNEMNYSAIAKDLNISRQTVSNKIRHMIKGEKPKKNETEDSFIPLIEYDEESQCYKLIPFQSNLALLVSQNTLTVMISLLRQHVISAYVYLYNRYIANGCKKYQFTYPQLKQMIGVGSKSRGNNTTITSILFGLQKLGLLKYTIQPTDLQRAYITWMTNQIEDVPNFDEITDQNEAERDKMKERYYKLSS